MKKKILFFLKGMIALSLVLWLIERVEWNTVGELLLSLSLPLLALYIMFQLFGTLLSAKKWQYLGKVQGFTFSLRDSFFAYLTGAFINNFLPSTIGGDTYRTLWLGKGGERFQAFTVIFFDRLSGLLALFLLATFGFFVLPWEVWMTSPWLIFLAALTAAVALGTLLALFYAYGIFELVLTVAEFLPWEKVVAFIKRFEVFARGDVYCVAFGYSLLFTMVGIGLNNYFLFQSLGAGLDIFTFGGVIFLATLVSNIPLSINTIGIKEWSYVFFFGLVGISTEMAVTAALLSRLLQMILSFLALPSYLRTRDKEKSP